MWQINSRIPIPRCPKPGEASLNAILCYPAKTLFEYLYIYGSSLTIDWDKEESSLLDSRQRKALLMETLSDNDLRDMLYQKRKLQEDQKLIDNFTWELARRSGKKLKFDPEEDRRRLLAQKASVSILTVVESYVSNLKYRRGWLIKCPMPDHKDSTASMSLNIRTGAWKCFGCNAGWGQIDFIMKMEWCSLKDAITKFLQY